MHRPLALSNYEFQTGPRIWSRPDYVSINYSDGDAVENRIAEIITNTHDVSLASDELAANCVDWTTTYHFSRARANILRPFTHLLRGKVLEIGAGCGAITRFLGEQNIEVLALEGSSRRASIASTRCRDLSNVTVLAEQFDAFDIDEKFDVVTLIGVLEYANLFTKAKSAHLSMLERARSFLAPGGKLIIAIENQLGLKYWAGAPEDHLGVPMYGIENLYQQNEAQTFGQKSLAALLKNAGFEAQNFYAALPDYKLAKVVISETGLSTPGFDTYALISQNVASDPQLPDRLNFCMERGWKPVVDNGLALDLANSFVVVAEQNPATSIPSPTDARGRLPIAYHFSVDRLSRFAKYQTFWLNPALNELTVEAFPIVSRIETESPSSPLFHHVLLPASNYVHGIAFSKAIVDTVTRPDWAASDLRDCVENYLDALKEILAADDFDTPLRDSSVLLPGKYLDASPQNILQLSDGTSRYIDAEWYSPQGVQLGWLLTRGIIFTLRSVTRINFFRDSRIDSNRALLIFLISSAGISFSRDSLEEAIEAEGTLQEFVSGKPALSTTSILTEWLEAPVSSPRRPKYRHSASLYFVDDDEQGFNEAFVVRAECRGEKAQFELELPELARLGSHLRCDPSDQAGWLFIEDLQLLDAAGNLQWSWENAGSQPSFVNAIVVAQKTEISPAVIYALNDDPMIFLPVGDAWEPLIGAGWKIRLNVAKPGDDELAIHLRDFSDRLTTGHLARVADLLEKVRSRDMDAEINRQEYARQLELTKSENAFEKEEADRARSQTATTLAELAALRLSQESERELWQQSLDSERKLVQNVLNTRSWRLTEPLRRAATFARRIKSRMLSWRN